MKRMYLILSFVLLIVIAASGQTKKLYSKINVLAVGYGMEYFFNPKISWHNELGFTFWYRWKLKIRSVGSEMQNTMNQIKKL